MLRPTGVLIVAMVAVVCSAGVVHAQAGTSLETIQEFARSEADRAGVPGVAYAVVDNGTVVATEGLGSVSNEGDTAVTADTPFAIGSVSKSFTALAVMQLVEGGQVQLDAPVSQYLDEFSSQTGGGPTISQLMSHLGGYSTVQGNTTYSDGGSDADTSDELTNQVQGLAAESPATAPGQRFDYSNANYQILGRVIEVASGQRYDVYVEANILEPIGMTNSFVADRGTYDSMATGHQPWFFGRRALTGGTTDRATAPQGGVIASAADMARYLLVMMNGEDDVLSAAGKAQMMRAPNQTSPTYGFGWYLDSGDGTVWHSGLVPGLEALAVMKPGDNSAVVVLLNANGGLGFGETVNLQNGIAARALGLPNVEGPAWPRQSLYLMVMLLPVFYLLCIAWAWRFRAGIRAKAGVAGLFSWWFPLLSTGVAAWVMVWLVPRMFGTPLGNLSRFQPDFVLGLVAGAVLGVVWAVFRLGVAYTGASND